MNKRGKVTPSNPSPNSFMQQNERKTLRTRSRRGKSRSGRMPRCPCKDYLIGTCTSSFFEEWHPPECLFYKTNGDTSIVAMLKSTSQSNSRFVSLYAKRFGAGQWPLNGPGSDRKWSSISEDSPQGEWDKMAEKMMVTFAESGHPAFRATSPLSRGVFKSEGGGILSIHFAATQATIETVFRIIVSVNQLSLYGAVEEMCEEYESCHDRAGGPVVRGQSSPSFVPSVIKTNIPLNDDSAHKQFLLQRHRERIEKLSQQDRFSKFCTDAGFPDYS